MPKILLVEDDEINRDMLSRRLERRGYQVVIAIDGEQAVVMARSQSPDLILMDMSLPVLDGWEATRQLRAASETRICSYHRPHGPCDAGRSRKGDRGGMRRLRYQASRISAVAGEDRGHSRQRDTTMSDKTIADDVTEQMITEDRESQPASLANVRHTLHTPLNHIIGYSEMLLEEASERGLEAFTADLQKIHKAGKQLLGFINDFFDGSTTDTAAAHVPKIVTTDGLFREAKPNPRLLPTIQRTAPGRILVVDDNESNRDMLSRRLQHEGYDVCITKNGHEALVLLSTQAVDLILLDVMMPDMDGYEVLVRLKTDSTLRRHPGHHDLGSRRN